MKYFYRISQDKPPYWINFATRAGKEHRFMNMEVTFIHHLSLIVRKRQGWKRQLPPAKGDVEQAGKCWRRKRLACRAEHPFWRWDYSVQPVSPPI